MVSITQKNKKLLTLCLSGRKNLSTSSNRPVYFNNLDILAILHTETCMN